MSVPLLPTLLDDHDFVAINKPAALAVIPGRDADARDVLHLLARQLQLPAAGPTDPRLRVVHRLDRDTSGVLLMAKHTAAQRHVSHQFQNNQTAKQYLALVAGEPREQSGTVEAALGPHPTSSKLMAVVRHGGRPARTDWEVSERYRGLTLLRVFPRTGKTHQIRVHLAHIDLPLAIDPLYNPKPTGEAGIFLSRFKRGYRPTAGEAERPLISRLTLHAQRLRFAHLNGQEIEIEAPLPKDLRAALNALGKHGRR